MVLNVSIISTLIAISIASSYPGELTKNMIAPGTFCTGLTFDGRNIWVTDYQKDKLYCINPDNGNILKEIESPGFWPMGLAWDGNYLWNVDKKRKKIFQIDSESGNILQTIDAPCKNPSGLTWDGKTIWISDSRANEIIKIDLSDGTAIKTIPGPAKRVNGLTFDGKYLWCSDRLQDEIYMISPESGEVIIILKSPGPYPQGLTWDGENLWNVDYQNNQIYRFKSKDDELYSLENTRHSRITFTHEVKITGPGKLHNLGVYIAIPEDLPQQKIATRKIIPATYQTVHDRWNQAFAQLTWANVPSEATLKSAMIIEAEISEIDYYIFPDRCGTLAEIPDDIVKDYTSDGSKYLIQDPYIRNLAEHIVGDEKNPYWIARKIFDYVRQNLEYKLEGGWNVAPVVLKRGTGSCSEYTFSFIALCRAAGLPARYVGSIVVRGEDSSLDEVFHRWPEVYLPNYKWIPIDPQGGDKERPRDRAMNIGHLSNRFLITTQGGGDSEYLGWYYNSNEKYITDPKIEVRIEAFATWQPLENE